MVIYGYQNEGEIEPSRLIEITLVATPSELRRVAKFLESAAENIEQMGENYDHEHLSDEMPELKGSPQLIVTKA